jgi:hypothetical protein
MGELMFETVLIGGEIGAQNAGQNIPAIMAGKSEISGEIFL